MFPFIMKKITSEECSGGERDMHGKAGNRKKPKKGSGGTNGGSDGRQPSFHPDNFILENAAAHHDGSVLCHGNVLVKLNSSVSAF